jgi:hypothetical protein
VTVLEARVKVEAHRNSRLAFVHSPPEPRFQLLCLFLPATGTVSVVAVDSGLDKGHVVVLILSVPVLGQNQSPVSLHPGRV